MPQVCRNCGATVACYEDWFADSCPKNANPAKGFGHEVPDYLRLPYKEPQP
jgi:hypothetical protein